MALTPNVVDGAPITSAWGNEIRDRSVQVFASAAARASAWTAPPEGAVSYLADVNREEFYDGTTWRPATFGGATGQTAIYPAAAITAGPVVFFTYHNVLTTDAGGFVTVAVPAGTFSQLWYVHGQDLAAAGGAGLELTVAFDWAGSSLTSLHFRVWRHDSNGAWASASVRFNVFAIGAP